MFECSMSRVRDLLHVIPITKQSIPKDPKSLDFALFVSQHNFTKKETIKSALGVSHTFPHVAR